MDFLLEELVHQPGGDRPLADGGATRFTEPLRTSPTANTPARRLVHSAAASVLASSVFPTPVGPRKMKQPIGRPGSLIPDRARDDCAVTSWDQRSFNTGLSMSVEVAATVRHARVDTPGRASRE